MWSRSMCAGLWAAAVSAGCSSVTTSEPPEEILVEVTGTITASSTGAPIDAALVEVVATTTTGIIGDVNTDADGVYAFSFIYTFFREENLPFCPFTIFVNATGYEEGTADLMCTGERETIDMALMLTP